MKITNLRQDCTNAMALDINGRHFLILGEAEISTHEARVSIPLTLEQSASIMDLREQLRFLDRQLLAVK